MADIKLFQEGEAYDSLSTDEKITFTKRAIKFLYQRLELAKQMHDVGLANYIRKLIGHHEEILDKLKLMKGLL